MAGDALTFRVAFVVRWLLWGVRFVVIWPLATMALMALFVLWRHNAVHQRLRWNLLSGYNREIYLPA